MSSEAGSSGMVIPKASSWSGETNTDCFCDGSTGDVNVGAAAVLVPVDVDVIDELLACAAVVDMSCNAEARVNELDSQFFFVSFYLVFFLSETGSKALGDYGSGLITCEGGQRP